MHHAHVPLGNQTISWYDQHATAYADRTLALDMSGPRAAFLRDLRPGARILDAGCGSGRDAKAFRQLGYDVTAFDGSSALARIARHHCGLPVRVCRFDEVNEEGCYDGIWACASLLHVPRGDLDASMHTLWRALARRGVLYASFKLGCEDTVVDGRHVLAMDVPAFRRLAIGLPRVAQITTWFTDDPRPAARWTWINVLVQSA